MLNTFQSAIDSSLRTLSIPSDPTVIAFGSYGRLDGNTAVSDFDFIFIYQGSRDDATVASLRNVVRNIVSSNQCLQFDHRDKIENGGFDFSASPAYPVISEEELLSEAATGRAVQVLTEGRIVHGDGLGTRSRHDRLKAWGFSPDATLLNLTKLRQALNGFKDSYCNGVMCRRTADGWKLTNRKALKVFALREFSYLATMFAIAETAISVATGNCGEDTAVQLISSPSALKIASFSSPRGALAYLLEDIGVPFRNDIVQKLRAHIDAVPTEDRVAPGAIEVDPGEGQLFGFLRELTIPVIIKYDALLSLLHNPEFMRHVDTFEPDITTWLGNRNFQRILTYRGEMVKAAIRLANALADVLDMIERRAHPIIADARAALDEVKAYKLREAGSL